MEPYQKLASIYDKDWGNFSTQYLAFVAKTCEKYGITISSVLELACGTGVLAIELDKKFKINQVDACDYSKEMIEVAKSKNSNVNFFKCDMRNFITDKKYNLITCAFDSINYILTEQDLLKTFKTVKKHLKSNGLFLFDFNTQNLYKKRHFGEFERTLDNQRFSQILNFNESTKVATTTFVFSDGSSEVHKQSAYSIQYIKALLTDASLEIKDMFENINEFSVANEASEKVFVVAG